MKIKILLAAAICSVLLLYTGCGGTQTNYGGGSSTEQTQTEATDESAENAENPDAEDGTADSGTAENAENPDADGQSETDETSQNADNVDEKSEVTAMYITIKSNKLEVQLADNSSVDALVEILKTGDITYTADDYGGFEKVGDIGHTLPRNDEQITTEAGDVILYLGSNICLYYGVNTWSFTRIGKINGYTDGQLKTLLCAGEGSVEITLSLN